MARYTGKTYSPYRETKHSRRGVSAFILGLVSLVMLIILLGWSASTGGSAPQPAGALGITAFFLGGTGLVLGLHSFSDNCRSYLFSKIGTVLCALISAVWFLIACVGFGA